MDDLTPNPNRCSEFDPHPFKKEKCKNCGRPWHEHKGVISEKHLHGFLKAKKDAENKRLQEEAEAKAKARAKVLAKKKASRSAEDGWFFDDEQDDAESEEEQLGFQMLEGSELNSNTATTPASPVEKQAGKPMKIVNLIDFGECDVKEEASTESGGEPTGPGLPGPMDQYQCEQSDVASSAEPESAAAPSGPGPEEVELMEEIEHLRQRLSDSVGERDVLVSIVQDEVAEKQRVIDDLMRQRNETEEKLKSTQESVEELTRQKEEAVRAAATAEAAASAAAAQAAEAVAAADAAAAAMAAAKSQQQDRARSPEPLRPSVAIAELKQGVPSASENQAGSNPAQLQVERAETDSLARRLLNPRVWTKCLRPPE